jgi:predicted nucleotidyltransferase
MLKQETYRALRNLPVGWLTHANHARDRSEKWFHYGVEIGLLTCSVLAMAAINCLSTVSIIVATCVVHSVWWVVNGNCHVYLLDSFVFIHNAGLARTMAYIEWCNHMFTQTGCVRAILIYGSFCRQKFHGRSDLDLRIVRKSGALAAMAILPMAVVARLVSVLRGVPTDLQVVDSYQFLDRQMRSDENPIVVYSDTQCPTVKMGMSFSEVQSNPQVVLEKRESP